jgi:hypothetical protein
MLIVVSSGCIDLKTAYVPGTVVTNGWYENTALRNSGSQFMGLEKWASLTYENSSNYPASLTVTTMKTLVLLDEKELQDRMKQSIQSTLQGRITLNESSVVTGDRYILKAHITRYMVYDAVDGSQDPPEQVKVIGEVWNCGAAGTSIICIGIAQITDTQGNATTENMDSWQKIVMDDVGTIGGFTGISGLIFNVVCH